MNLKLVKITVVFAVCSVALIGGAIAQEPREKTTEKAPESKSEKKAVIPPAVAGRMVLGVDVVEADLIAIGSRVSKLMGAPVYNDSEEKIGKIEDVITTPKGDLSVAIVEVGGFLGGVGKHRVAIPVSQFRPLAPEAVLPGASKTALKNMPEFEYVR
ncbi:PRC-barrel domain-containing protein [Nitrosovibrio tenuis]|uniref:PRC-barrel domain-containing protein n=1 Tax=Nitrosovibrio tenuis TaxID=1233 RepID=A0A1H7IKG4_9PROT|nr:PRC-barrel domain-containing protein [Nitrosovibrio tenuis]SEK62352.1 PRC-barrel domain-containing protein [Nitrosovibrio tenuis]